MQILQGGQNRQNENLSGNLNLQNLAQNFSLNDLLNQSPLLAQISTSITQIQHFYAETKGIVSKLEKGELSQNELVAFLERLRF